VTVAAPASAAPGGKVSGGIDPNLLVRALRGPLLAALEALGDKAVSEIQASLSEPWPPASRPGEAPHRRTGTLQANVEHVTLVSGETGLPELTVMSDRPAVGEGDDSNAAVVLEMELDRPYMRPAFTRLETTAAAFLASRLGAENK
jgi:hypothetical protein